MKTTNLNFAKMALYLFLGLSITLISCSGEDGEMGPQGPAGVDGIDGADGKDGADGVDGEDGVDGVDGEDGADGQNGNANVIVSDWVPISFEDRNTSVPATLGYIFLEDGDIPEVDLNAFVRTGGVVILYFKAPTNNGSITAPVPHDAGSLHIRTYILEVGSEFAITLRVEDTDVSNYETGEYFFRYVLVPANVAETTGIADKMPQSFGEAAVLLGLEQ